MKTLKLFLITALISIGTLHFAKAQTAFHVGIGGPGFHMSVGNSPYYYHHYYRTGPAYCAPAPARVYYEQPAPVYYEQTPAPVYYEQESAGYCERPVVVYRRYDRGYYHPWHHHGYGEYHRAYYGRGYWR